ncbi:MAG: hypothetical protein H0U70_01390 [Tatlockia sp.]|nr:hypothetical protein [Tatlockia sp.]
MFNKIIAEAVYKYIEHNKIDKLASFLKEKKNLTAISLVSVVDLLVKDYGFSLEELKKQGAIVEVGDLLENAQSYLQKVQTNPELKGALKSVKQGLESLIVLWKEGKLKNEAAEQFFNAQAIQLIQNSPQHGAKEVDDYVLENIKTQLNAIYSQWLNGDKSVQDLIKLIDATVQGRIYTAWKSNSTFDYAIQQKLVKNVNTLLSNNYHSGNLPEQMAETIESAVIDMLLGLVRNETLGQYKKLETYFSSTVAILLKGSKPFDMTSTYTKAFHKIMTECKNGVLGDEIPNIIQQFNLEAIQSTKFDREQVSAFEEQAAQELIIQFKQSMEDFPDSMPNFIENAVLEYLENRYTGDKEFGASIKNRVINMLLVEWKELESPELRNAVEAIVMQECNAIIEKVNTFISGADSETRILELEEKLSLVTRALIDHGVTIELTEREVATAELTKTVSFGPTSIFRLFDSRELQFSEQKETPTKGTRPQLG